MTLKELLDKVEFDALCPYLEKYEPKHLDNIYAFREAYDILRTLTPSKQASGAGQWRNRRKMDKRMPYARCELGRRACQRTYYSSRRKTTDGRTCDALSVGDYLLGLFTR